MLAIVYRPEAKALVLISAACVAYGYLMKPLGLIVATGGGGLRQRLRRP